MAKPRLQTYTRFRDGKRSFIYSGDKFRASAGPYYIGQGDDGKRVRIPMGERGVFVFSRYCELGASKWIEARGDGHRTVIICVGRKRKSPNVDGVLLKPHKIRPVYENQKRSNKSVPQRVVQKELFEMTDVSAK